MDTRWHAGNGLHQTDFLAELRCYEKRYIRNTVDTVDTVDTIWHDSPL